MSRAGARIEPMGHAVKIDGKFKTHKNWNGASRPVLYKTSKHALQAAKDSGATNWEIVDVYAVSIHDESA